MNEEQKKIGSAIQWVKEHSSLIYDYGVEGVLMFDQDAKPSELLTLLGAKP